MTRRLILAALALAAAAGSVDLLDSQTGERLGVVREIPGGRVDLFDRESRRAGWGRRNADGSIELFDRDSNRIGTSTKDGRIFWLERKGRGKP